jgi:hypothetical protein
MRVAAIGFYLLFLGFVGDKILEIILDMSLAEPGSAPFVMSTIQLMLLTGVLLAMAILFIKVLRAPGPKAKGKR